MDARLLRSDVCADVAPSQLDCLLDAVRLVAVCLGYDELYTVLRQYLQVHNVLCTVCTPYTRAPRVKSKDTTSSLNVDRLSKILSPTHSKVKRLFYTTTLLNTVGTLLCEVCSVTN